MMAVVVDLRGAKVAVSGIFCFLGAKVSFGDDFGLGMYFGGVMVWYGQVKV